MKKILILTAAFGDGHNTAARNIRDALEHICDDVKGRLAGTAQRAIPTIALNTYRRVAASLSASSGRKSIHQRLNLFIAPLNAARSSQRDDPTARIQTTPLPVLAVP